jgi:ubiquitin carboxyl-terminal hydrolase 5/13
VFTLGRFPLRRITLLFQGSNSIGSHYVAFIRKIIPGERLPDWILYNDEKVVKAVDVEEMKKFAYVYLFQRA